jgi:hypothetical protein
MYWQAVHPVKGKVYMKKIAPYKHIADLELSMGALRKAGLK